MTSHDPLPPHLERLGQQLTVAACELNASSRARPRLAARMAATVGAVAVAATASVVILDQPAGESAFASQTIERAAAVVLPPASPDTILHIVATETLSPRAQRADATTVSTFTEQAWIQQGSPWGQRTIEQTPGGPMLESDSSGGIYNQTNNTIYPAPQLPAGKPQYTLTAIGGGNYRLTAPLPNGGVSTAETIDASTAQALRDGTDAVSWAVMWDGRTQQIGPTVMPSAAQASQLQAQQPSAESLGFAAGLRGLLHSGHARVTRTTTADGQPAIEISSVDPQSGPRTNYYVDPQTYAPIELDIFGYDSPNDVTRVHITTYETLPLAGNQQLLQTTPPANATIDHTPADYWNSQLPPLF